MTEGLYTSELGPRSDDADHDHQYGLQPTRTISLSDFQRRNVFSETHRHQHSPRPVLPRRNAGIKLVPRAPDATVTASVIEVNLNDGETTSKVTEVPAATTDAVVSLDDLVSLTVPAVSDATDLPDPGDATTAAPTTTPPDPSSTGHTTTSSTTSDLSPAGSVLSDALNSTSTIDTTGELTVTVTETSTVEVSITNGTVILTATSLRTGSSGLPRSSYATLTDSTTTAPRATFGVGFTYESDPTPTPTGFIGIGTTSFGTPTSSEPSSTSTSDSDGGDSGPGLSPKQQQVVGGVVGVIAGIALALAIVLYVLRWYRGRLKARGELPEQIASRSLPGGGTSYAMSERSSVAPFAAAMASSLKRLRPHSNTTLDTTVTNATDGSEQRGFQRIAGRKLAPVLSTGGDQYGGNYGAFEKEAFEKETNGGVSDPMHGQSHDRGLSGSSFYHDRDGFYAGRGTASPTFPSSPTTETTFAKAGDFSPSTSSPSIARDFARPSLKDLRSRSHSQVSIHRPSRPDGIAVMRPSPARTPVTLSPTVSSIRLPIQQPPVVENAPPLPEGLSAALERLQAQGGRDGIGRSLASQDVSRSSGRSGGRFMENV